ncbi:MAG: leucine-rich repeat domain-containing protein, partial [Lachnospiraceae bacterium]|nr:leucine-rich repeat domain-containing protein [Lachnospiraceae bacterium]
KDESSNDLVNVSKYTMPDTVTSISPYAFYGCKNIESITLSNGLEEIPEYAFSYCNGLTYMSIPYCVNRIDVKAFQYCVNLEKVDIPISVNFIHETAFDGCSKLNIVAPEGSYAYNWFKRFDNSSVNIIDKEDNKSSDSKDSKDTSAAEEPDNAYVRPDIEGLISETVIVGRQAVFFIDNTKQTVVDGPGFSNDTTEYAEIVEQMETVLQTETHGKGLSLPKFANIGDKIAGKAFYEDKTLTEYTVPSNVTSIGDFSFARSNLESITIPSSVTHIGYGAFYHCDNLAQILVPGTVTDIEPSAFDKTRMMQNWKLYGESDFLIMGDGILVAYKGSGSYVEIPEGVKQIGPLVFKNNTSLTEVSIPDSVWRVCEEAFYGCSNLKSVTGGMEVEVIEDRAFAGCPVETVRIVDTVRKLGAKAFDLDMAMTNASNRVVMFNSGTLPLVSYNKTTSRLTNSAYRGDALEGVHVAVVSNEGINRLNSVLDRNESGFSGLICVISEPPTEYFNGTLNIIDCTLTASEAASVVIPETVYIYGKGYNFMSDQLSSVMNMARAGAYYEDMEKPQTVSFTGGSERYILDVIKDSYVNISVKDAYKRIYGDTVPANFTTYTIYMTEEDSGVRITKFGKQTYPITITLPDNMPTSNLHVICIDEYDQLEDLPFTVKENDGKLSVEFNISHTGYYGLYSFNSTAVSKYDLDVSPDTGDPIHPKWFLAIGLMAMGLVFILIKGKDKVSVKA